MEAKSTTKIIYPDDTVDRKRHYYPKVGEQSLHPTAKRFFSLSMDDKVALYRRRHPLADPTALKRLISYQPKYSFWIGNDFFPIYHDSRSELALLESNSCPSGNKSLPVTNTGYNNYQFLIEKSFLPQLKKRKLPNGKLAVIYDTNPMENEYYAQTIARLTGEEVILYYRHPAEPHRVIYRDEQLYLLHQGLPVPIRGVFRYLTQYPWKVFRAKTTTFVFNPIEVCLSGGRNKLMANRAYRNFNGIFGAQGLAINYPHTVSYPDKESLEKKIKETGYRGVIKIPYLNKGQGVFTICGSGDWQRYLRCTSDSLTKDYLFQNLLGNETCSTDRKKRHRFTRPDHNGNQYIYDLRMMCCSTAAGIVPVSAYARRSRDPVNRKTADPDRDSWNLFGTNISVRNSDGSFGTDPDRLLSLSGEEFPLLQLDLVDLTDAYFQTVFSMVAIDQLAISLSGQKGFGA
jgi:hypothetical protein